jgi:membrane-associated phospholipid phosphatase
MTPRRCASLASLLAVLVATVPAGAAAAPDSADALPPPRTRLLQRADLAFLGGTLAAMALAVPNDRWLTAQAASVGDDRTQRRLADAVRPLGHPLVLLPTAVGLSLAGRWTGRTSLARGAGRIAITVVLSDVVAGGLKPIVGRARPNESLRQSERFEPFSGHVSFPSVHASTAFATAVAVDRETRARWVPWVVYPVATLVGWSRVHDLEHWTSDVVAGAAIGGWTAWKVEDVLQRRTGGASSGQPRASVRLVPLADGFAIRVTRELR